MELTVEKYHFINSASRISSDITDLANVLNALLSLSDHANNSDKPITSKELFYYSYNKDHHYSNFEIPKKLGGARKIQSPSTRLRMIQRGILLLLEFHFCPIERYTIKEGNDQTPLKNNYNKAANGFLPRKSIVSNAMQHVGMHYVYNIDISDFFPSISFGRIKQTLKSPPFHYTDQVAHIIGNIATLEGRLPQGAPTSPMLSNIVSQKLDRKLSALAKSRSCVYSRYADDISFSCDYNVFRHSFKTTLQSIIEEENFSINPKKSRLQTATQRQEVTGIIVNNKINVPRKLIREIRALLHNWRTIGESATQERFNSFYSKKPVTFKRVLYGKLMYLKMVRGSDDIIFMRYMQEFNRLSIHDNRE